MRVVILVGVVVGLVGLLSSAPAADHTNDTLDEVKKAVTDGTAVLLDDMTATDQDVQMQSIAHAVIRLEELSPDYGAERRRMRVVKYRGMKFRGGFHDYMIERGGLRVFPRLVASEHRGMVPHGRLGSDVPELDLLLGGGLEAGTSTLIVGSAGTGKSTLAAQFAAAASHRGGHR